MGLLGCAAPRPPDKFVLLILVCPVVQPVGTLAAFPAQADAMRGVPARRKRRGTPRIALQHLVPPLPRREHDEFGGNARAGLHHLGSHPPQKRSKSYALLRDSFMCDRIEHAHLQSGLTDRARVQIDF